jgi:hypothetical protein
MNKTCHKLGRQDNEGQTRQRRTDKTMKDRQDNEGQTRQRRTDKTTKDRQDNEP